MAPSPGPTPTIKASDPQPSTGAGVKREHSDDTPANPAPDRKRARVALKECSVCINDVAKNQFPKAPHAQTGDEKKHSSDVCFKCYDQHIQAEIAVKGFEDVGCPQCSQTLKEAEVRKLTKRTGTYKKYIDKAAKECMQQDEEFHECPNAGCSWGAIFAKDDGNIFNCQMCKSRYCLSCKVPFHEGQLCEDFLAAKAQRDLEEANEQKSIATVSEISKKCPSDTCGVNIEKISGCDHVTCTVPPAPAACTFGALR